MNEFPLTTLLGTCNPSVPHHVWQIGLLFSVQRVDYEAAERSWIMETRVCQIGMAKTSPPGAVIAAAKRETSCFR